LENKTRGFEHVSEEQWIVDTGTDGETVPKIPSLPRRSTVSSAGYDIFVPYDILLEPNQEIKIPCGFKAYMLEDEFLMLVPRSGLGFKFYTRLANTVGIVDSDYYNNSGNEGHCFLKMRNEGRKTLSVKQGDAVAQAIFQKFLLADKDAFVGKSRYGGFGSTDLD